MRPARLQSYGDLTVRSAAGGGEQADEAEGKLAEVVFAGAAAPIVLTMHRVTNGAIEAQDKTVSYRR